LPETIKTPATGRLREEALPRVARSVTPRYSVLFCGLFLPRYPGLSGGEIRDFFILRELARFCRLSFVPVHEPSDSPQIDLLSPALNAVWNREAIMRQFPKFIHLQPVTATKRPIWRVMDYLRRRNFPVLGPKLPRDASLNSKVASAFIAQFTQSKLENEHSDFFFVSPQVNPIGILIDKSRFSSRMILATYDVETVRLRRMVTGMKTIHRAAGLLEARRAQVYERRNLSVYDGVIVVSELDRSILVNEMGFDSDRIISIENGVNTNYFAFRKRQDDGPPAVLFVGQLGYRPNHVAAMRLVDRIMPLVWRVTPEAQVWIVGQQPKRELVARSDERRIFVTGEVESVRPYLDRCWVVCVPLEMGSGTKYKVIEALAAGAPVVCTPLATEGLNLVDEHVVVGESDLELADAISWALRNRDRAASMSQRARILIEKQYAWDVILTKLQPWLDRIAALPRIG
jgi:glycosyltransferase involved in cell wall biosynthesis